MEVNFPARSPWADKVRIDWQRRGTGLDGDWQYPKPVALGRSGLIRMGFGGSMLYRGMPEILADVEAALPGIDVTLKEMGSVAQIEALYRDEIDPGLIHGHATPDGLDGFLYHAEPFVACLPATHRLAMPSGSSFVSCDKMISFYSPVTVRPPTMSPS